jgi:hypothetical protein
MVLGAYWAMQSGTVDAIVYDTLIEEVGGGEGFEKRYVRPVRKSSRRLRPTAR